MSEQETKRARRRRLLPALLIALSVGVAGVALAACGGGENASSGEAQERIEKGAEEAKKGIEKGREEAKRGVERGKEEIKKGIEKGKEEAQEGIEEAEKHAKEYAP